VDQRGTNRPQNDPPGKEPPAPTVGGVEEPHRLLMECVTDYAIFFLDPHGQVAIWNAGAERIFGYTEAEIVGQHFSHFFTPEDVQQGIPEKELQTAATAGRANDDRWLVRKGGARLWCNGVTTALRDGEDRLRGFAKVLRDRTEPKRLQEALHQRAEQLAQEARQKDDFLAVLAHELRNPLAPVRNAVEVMRLRDVDDPGLRWARDIIDRQVQQMTRLVDDLLDVSRITRGKVTLQKEPVDLAAVVARAVEVSRPLIDARRHDLTVTLPPEPVRLEADAIRLAQVVANLLNNAAKYTDESGHIWLTVEREGDQAVVRVKDNGIGIRPDLLPQVFDLFVQSDRALDRSQGGLGIGLTLVKSLVEMHGGSVTAHSEGPGQGSGFVVCLPALTELRSGDSGKSGTGRRVESSARRILVVDDNGDAADSLAVLLRLMGNDVRTAPDGPAALEAARAYRPDVVLLDLGLPGMSGYDVCRRLREGHFANGPLVVALTGYGQDEDRRRTREAGFDRHLVKPVNPDELREVLAENDGRANSPGFDPERAGCGHRRSALPLRAG
jgi:PAS domain S-box-containing protein